MPGKPRTRAARTPPTPSRPADPTAPGSSGQDRELRAQGRKTMRRLLDAGRVVFERRGFHATRVDDIVTMARTSHGTFYLYFANKEDLFTALAMEALHDLESLADELAPITADAAGRAALRDWIARFCDVYARHGTVIRSWTEGEVVRNDLGRQGRMLFGRQATAIAARMREAGVNGLVDPEIAALACLSMLERFNYLVQSRQISFDRESMIDTLAATTYAGFFLPQPDAPARRVRSARRA